MQSSNTKRGKTVDDADAVSHDAHMSISPHHSPAPYSDGSQDGEDADVVRPLQPARPIQRLDEAVVNRIAAGEIIHRPANALKELIENSLDAGADLIKITLKEGGLKLLQIQDNGCGVRPSDLSLLCERFATSKLRDFSDLSKMTTFGFRGEALASISFVSASMSILTKTKDEALAYKAFYSAGEMVPAKPGQSSDPKACAGTDGTTIAAQDLFFNVPQRRRALKSAAEEYNRALDVAAKYALHYGARGVGFVCKKSGSNAADLSTPASPNTKTLDTIRLLHGNAVARELVHLKISQTVSLSFSVEGWISGANWSTKRTTFLCFINDRLVDCPALKRSFESLYSALLPKGGHPWIYVSLKIDPDKVDVNVHPTKREVHFLDEEDIIERICSEAQTVLAGANTSRTFQFTQAILPGAMIQKARTPATGNDGSEDATVDSQSTQAASATQYPQHLVRVDNRARTLDGMFTQASQKPPHEPELLDSSMMRPDQDLPVAPPARPPAPPARRSRMQIPLSDCSLTSIVELRASVAQQRHSGLSDILQNHTFVGVIDVVRGLSLLQHGTKLYLADHDALIEECAYQLCLRQFGAMPKRKMIGSKPYLRELIELGIHIEATDDVGLEVVTGLSRAELVEQATCRLLDNSAMLSEYFSLDLDRDNGEVTALPSLLADQDVLPVENLPTFFLRLATQVDWTEEKKCFESFARELAYAHVFSQNLTVVENDRAADGRMEAQGVGAGSAGSEARSRWKIQHVWFPHMASRAGGFIPSRALVKEDKLIQVASLNDLYRIFERC